MSSQNSHRVTSAFPEFRSYRLVTLTRKSEHITPVLRFLNWLPVHYRINFKILLVVYQILHQLAPDYLQDLISLRSSSTSRHLRSSSTLQLSHGPLSTTRYGDRAFSTLAPILWNKLPHRIQDAPTLDSFKSLLKTYLFNQP